MEVKKILHCLYKTREMYQWEQISARLGKVFNMSNYMTTNKLQNTFERKHISDNLKCYHLNHGNVIHYSNQPKLRKYLDVNKLLIHMLCSYTRCYNSYSNVLITLRWYVISTVYSWDPVTWLLSRRAPCPGNIWCKMSGWIKSKK